MSQDYIDTQFLRTFHPDGQVFTCKNGLVDHVVKACREAGWPLPILYNAGYAGSRDGGSSDERFDDVVMQIKDTVETEKPRFSIAEQVFTMLRLLRH